MVEKEEDKFLGDVISKDGKNIKILKQALLKVQALSTKC